MQISKYVAILAILAEHNHPFFRIEFVHEDQVPRFRDRFVYSSRQEMQIGIARKMRILASTTDDVN